MAIAKLDSKGYPTICQGSEIQAARGSYVSKVAEGTEEWKMSDRYILNKHGEPVPEPDLMTWGKWLESSKMRVVKQEKIWPAMVSTVFLGLDHRFGPGTPILWESMVFSGPMDGEQDRCSGNRDQAEAMHARMIVRVCEAHTFTAVAKWVLMTPFRRAKQIYWNYKTKQFIKLQKKLHPQRYV